VPLQYILKIKIVRFVDENQPGWVEGEFCDAQGQCHKVIDKIPVIADTDLWADSEYPASGSIGCEILERFRDEGGQELARITTRGIESTAGLTEFTVFANLLASPDA